MWGSSHGDVLYARCHADMTQQQPLIDQVLEFYYDLFRSIFFEPICGEIDNRIRRDSVGREIDEAAAAASQSLIRFFQSERVSNAQVVGVLAGFAALRELITLERVRFANVMPEALAEEVLAVAPVSAPVKSANKETVYRVALHLVLQVMVLVGPIIHQWREVKFSSTLEFLRIITNQLNTISEQMNEFATAGQEAVDDRFELTYRDNLLQRWYRVEAGTVRMTTNLTVDLRRLFVPPRVKPRRIADPNDEQTDGMGDSLMDLAAARKYLTASVPEQAFENVREQRKSEDATGVLALKQVQTNPRTVIVGPPGSGKSTFLEWLQLQVAAAEEEFPLGGQQAIPLLLRVRQLDPLNLPTGSAFIAAATGSDDRAKLMPQGWIDRQFRAGRILFMVDGLDETEPEVRDHKLLPWLAQIVKRYGKCHFLISSRPVGYPRGLLRRLGFVECDILDFDNDQIAEYTKHWCTAVRLARNESEEEARREGTLEGEHIVESFRNNRYIVDLARNPLMLSAICLVNYFEGGKLPQDRALLYKLCVEGLLHHWDQRRGIHSEYALNEKLAVCREVAIAMQVDDRAEYEADRVEAIFAGFLENNERAKALLEHIRYRSGLLLERRPNTFAFAHLTFSGVSCGLCCPRRKCPQGERAPTRRRVLGRPLEGSNCAVLRHRPYATGSQNDREAHCPRRDR